MLNGASLLKMTLKSISDMFTDISFQILSKKEKLESSERSPFFTYVSQPFTFIMFPSTITVNSMVTIKLVVLVWLSILSLDRHILAFGRTVFYMEFVS